MDFLAAIISIAPALTFAHSGTSALPGVLAFSSAEPVLTLVDVAVNHKLSGLLVSVPVIVVQVLFVWEHFIQVTTTGNNIQPTATKVNSEDEITRKFKMLRKEGKTVKEAMELAKL